MYLYVGFDFVSELYSSFDTGRMHDGNDDGSDDDSDDDDDDDDGDVPVRSPADGSHDAMLYATSDHHHHHQMLGGPRVQQH